MRTPFVDYNGALAQISPIDLGIKAAREVFARSGASPDDVGTVITGNMAQASFDAYLLPRHIGLYSGVPIETPAHMVQRVCGTGIEVLMQAADTITHRGVDLALCVGTESMSRNPIAAYTHRGGFRMGQVEFKDFLWEALMDRSANVTMGDTAENLARQYQITRAEVDAYAARSFERAVTAQEVGFLAGEIAPVTTEEFAREGYNARGIRLSRDAKELDHDTHIRPSTVEALAKIRPAFGGVQTGGNSSAIVDGAAAALVASADYAKTQRQGRRSARLVAGAAAGVPPEIMGIGPVPAIQAVLEKAGLKLADIDRFEINEAFGAQVMACARALDLDEDKLNVNGGAIAIGHPLGATGVRLSVTLARELKRSGLRYGIASACIGGGQGIALLIENPDAEEDTEMDIKGHAAIVTGGGSGLGAATAAELAQGRRQGRAARRQHGRGERACAEDRRHRDQVRCVGLGQRRSRHQGGEREERRRPHPDQLRRHRHRQAHRRARRPAAARRLRARHQDQPDRLVQHAAPVRRRPEPRPIRWTTASAASRSTPPRSRPSTARSGRRPIRRPRAASSALTLPAARELAQFGIRVCAIAPGIFLTPMLLGLSEEVAEEPRRLGAVPAAARQAGGICRARAPHRREPLSQRRGDPPRRRAAHGAEMT